MRSGLRSLECRENSLAKFPITMSPCRIILPPGADGDRTAPAAGLAPPVSATALPRADRNASREEPATILAGRDPQDAQERPSHRVGAAEPALAGDPVQPDLRPLQEPAG